MGLIGIDVSGLKELRELALKLPDAVFDAITEDVGDYLVNVLRSYPPKNYVTRKAAYGQTFFSDRQRRWFFAALRSGDLQIPGKRTQTLAQGWKRLDDLVYNEVEYAKFVMGEDEQSRHEAMVGWLTTDQVVQQRATRIVEIGQAAAKKAIRRLGG